MNLRKLPVGDTFALVDARDFSRCSQLRWRPHQMPFHRTVYARSTSAGYLHRFVLLAPPGTLVDHVDDCGLHCWRSNLRIVTPAQNQHKGPSHLDSTSRFKGVSWHALARKWQAEICKRVNGKRVRRYLGLHETEAEAAMAYDTAATELFGDFARLNFPADQIQGITQ